jgi:hypothetical protein
LILGGALVTDTGFVEHPEREIIEMQKMTNRWRKEPKQR